eukprot:5303460-Pleurochrysis_carterae.AAC.1
MGVAPRAASRNAAAQRMERCAPRPGRPASGLAGQNPTTASIHAEAQTYISCGQLPVASDARRKIHAKMLVLLLAHTLSSK